MPTAPRPDAVPATDFAQRIATWQRRIEAHLDRTLGEPDLQALRQSRATPAEIAREAEAAGVWATMEPYVMALTSDA